MASMLARLLTEPAQGVPPVGAVQLGSFDRITPISRMFGYDRGNPVDRYYIESFLERYAGDIRGRTLEIEDATYTRRFGGEWVGHPDVLHVNDRNPQATIVGDLTLAPQIPSDSFDCVILTQTLHLIYDYQAAIETLYRILKPGGVLLLTVPGITQLSPDEWRESWYWAFTGASARRLFAERFGDRNVAVEVHGNVLAAISFLHGVAAEELPREHLDYADSDYPVTIAVRAVKPAKPPVPASAGAAQRQGSAGGGLVSVIVPFLNPGAFFPEAIDSVLSQSYDGWELVLVDDGSTDGSADVARDYASRFPDRIRCVAHENRANRGISASRNLGLAHAAGDFVCFLDADDAWLPHKLERQLAIFRDVPRAAMVFGTPLYWYGWTGRIDDLMLDHIPEIAVPADKLYEPPELMTLLYPLGVGNAPSMSDYLARKSLLETVGGYEEPFEGFYEDQAFLAKVYLRAPIYIAGECWSRYRIHDASCTAETQRAGQYAATRERFLAWLDGHLETSEFDHPIVRRALEQARAEGASGAARVREILDAPRRWARLRLEARRGDDTLDRAGTWREEASRWMRLARAREVAIHDQRAWVQSAANAKSWLEEQVRSWKSVAEEREKMILDLKSWIDELERGKQWLESEWRTWKDLATEREKLIESQARRIAELEAAPRSRPTPSS